MRSVLIGVLEVAGIAAVVFGYFFLGTFATTELPNVYDVAGDRAIGVSTLPTEFGVARTRQALYLLDLAGACLVSFALVNGYAPLELAVPLLVGLVYSIGVSTLVGRVDDGTLVTIASESEYVLVGLLLVPYVFGI